MSTVAILNPQAGRGWVGRNLDSITRGLRQSAGSIDIQITRAPGHARQLAQAAPPGSRVVAVGGDGTLHEVVGGLAFSNKSLGVVAVGSGNDAARMLDLFHLPLEQQIRVALGSRTQRIDLGSANGVPYISSFSAGFDAMVSHHSLAAKVRFRGLPRYLYSIFGVLKDLTLPELRLTAGSQTLYQGQALIAALLNSPTYGAGIPIAPMASCTDGQLSAVVAGRFSKPGVLAILPRLLVGRHLSHAQIFTFAGPQFSLEYNRPVPAQTDGEVLPSGTRYDLSIHPLCLEVAQP
jgi:diacylglycerol kinase (ATP)